MVVTYNRLDLLKELIQALRVQSQPLDQVIVVDNGSSDGTRAWLTELEPATFLIHLSETNAGGAGGFSKGLELAFDAGHSYAWLMDDDACPEPEAHRALHDALEYLSETKQRVAFLSSRVIDEGGRTIATHNAAGATPPLDGSDTLGKIYPTCRGSFVGAFIVLEVARDTFLPIADFFIYHDDAEYTARLTKFGGGFLVDASRIRHPDKVSNGDMGARLLYDLRNRIWIRRNVFLGSEALRAELTDSLVRYIAVRGKSSDSKRLFVASVLKAVWQGVAKRPSRVWPS
ncbi:glycosyltransferase family 2 protein [Williamsia herbipolensis]|uniref:glycosyltransferase family 2 protein n=1 Tax=Williamsia herbipolensis TaxID=1603258 RepID=UPI001364DAF0|nr:glycosyltransferase family 2 protein [Williamsia herbipolensis]